MKIYEIISSKNMTHNFPSSQQLNPQGQEPQQALAHITFMHNNIRYRMQREQYEQNIQSLEFWVGLWLVGWVVSATVLVSQLVGLGDQLWLGTFSITALIFSFKMGFRIGWARNSHTGQIISVLLLALYGLLCWITLIINVKEYVWLGCITSKNLPSIIVILDILNMIIYSTTRPLLIVRICAYFQLLLLGEKLNNDKELSWDECFFFVMLLWFMCSIIEFSMMLFFTINVLCFREPLTHHKHYGLAYISFNTVCVLLTASIPLSKTSAFSRALPTLPFLCMFAMFAHILTICFICKRRNQICMFFCQIQPVKQYNQIITLKEQQHVSQIFVKKGENWYVPDEPQPPQQSVTTFSEDKLAVDQTNEFCLICLERLPDFLWSPCNHLTTCRECAENLVKHKNINCILCKKVPEVIWEVEEFQSSSLLKIKTRTKYKVIIT